MPLAKGGLQLVRSNLEQIAQGRRVGAVVIGHLTERQLGDINRSRQLRANPLLVVISEVLFIGQHIFNSRIARDGYTIDDALDQIASALDISASFLPTSRVAAIQNHIPRLDRYGSLVKDLAVFECTARHPRPELFSVILKGDRPPKS